MVKKELTVSADGNGDFRKIQEAIDIIPLENAAPVVIRIKNGIYNEKVRIQSPYISLIGENPEKTVLTFNDFAKKLFPDGTPMNTFNSYTVYIGGRDFTAENITFENSSGMGAVVGQAIAAYVDADRAVFKNCRFLGYQDTLFTGPLPKNPTPKGLNLVYPTLGSGPNEYSGAIRQYYTDCFIKGDIDFIFGSATAVFNRCEIFSNRLPDSEPGYITAASTFPNKKYGYVMLDCKLTGDASPGSVYLGRPWRDFANVVWINCWMGAHIHPEAWHNWDLPERQKTVTYREYHSHGPGSAVTQRVNWAQQLTSEEAKEYTIPKIFFSPDGWYPK